MSDTEEGVEAAFAVLSGSVRTGFSQSHTCTMTSAASPLTVLTTSQTLTEQPGHVETDKKTSGGMLAGMSTPVPFTGQVPVPSCFSTVKLSLLQMKRQSHAPFRLLHLLRPVERVLVKVHGKPFDELVHLVPKRNEDAIRFVHAK